MASSKDGLQGRCKACSAKYQKALRKRKSYLRQHGSSLPEKAEFINQLHMRRARQNFTDITSDWMIAEWRRVLVCPLCSRRLAKVPGRPSSRNLDHIVPIAEGGRHMMANVRIICRTCNLTRKYVP